MNPLTIQTATDVRFERCRLSADAWPVKS